MYKTEIEQIERISETNFSKKGHISLLDRLNPAPTYGALREIMSYDGSLDDTLNAITLNIQQPDREWNDIDLFFQVPRIVRATVDNKIRDEYSLPAHELICDSIQLAQSLYKHADTRCLTEIETFKQKVTEYFPGLYHEKLKQLEDVATITGSLPQYSIASVELIHRLCGEQPVSLIVLGHGGVAAGLDVFLNVSTFSPESTLYVVRFSQHKSNEDRLCGPRVSTIEVEYLRTISKDKQVIIFDEDRSQGTTIQRAGIFFGTHIFPDQKVLLMTNHRFLDNDEYSKLPESHKSPFQLPDNVRCIN